MFPDWGAAKYARTVGAMPTKMSFMLQPGWFLLALAWQVARRQPVRTLKEHET